MFRTTNYYLTGEILKWIAILMMTALVLIYFAATAGAVTPGSPPNLLPETIDAWAKPLPPALLETADMIPIPDVAPNTARSQVLPDQDPLATDALIERVWQVLELHDASQAEEAITLWGQIQLPLSSAVWKDVALGAAYLELSDWENAETALGRALAHEPANPLPHYYLGLLRLEQAAAALDWHDAVGPRNVRLAAYGPQSRPLAPNSRGMYLLAARMKLEDAIHLAANVPSELALVRATSAADALLSPTVDDLLRALGSHMFEGDAHHVLGTMLLDQENLDRAETHLDAATAAGVHVLYGYRELGAAYEQADRHLDAVRAYAKSMRQGADYALPTKRLLENLGKALQQDLGG